MRRPLPSLAPSPPSLGPRFHVVSLPVSVISSVPRTRTRRPATQELQKVDEATPQIEEPAPVAPLETSPEPKIEETPAPAPEPDSEHPKTDLERRHRLSARAIDLPRDENIRAATEPVVVPVIAAAAEPVKET